MLLSLVELTGHQPVEPSPTSQFHSNITIAITDGPRKLVSARDCVLIVWHLRIGDKVLNTWRPFYEKVSEEVSSALYPLHCCVIFVTEIEKISNATLLAGGSKSKDSLHWYKFPKQFEFLEQVCAKYFGGRCALPSLSLPDAIYHMIHCDLLITSGSSLPLLAAELRINGKVLEPPSKEGVRGIYETSDADLLDQNGTILSTSPQEFSSRVKLAFYDRTHNWDSVA